MADNNDNEQQQVVVHPDHHDDQENADAYGALAPAVENNKKDISRLKLELAKKDAELRRTVEELSLHQELQTVNQSTLRKLDHDTDRKNRMPISEESLARILALETAIKNEDKKHKELQRESDLTMQALATVDQGIEESENTLVVAEESTGYSRQKGRGQYVDPENAFRAHQKELAKLKEEQDTLKRQTQMHTATIQALSQELESLANVDADFEEAKGLLAGKAAELKHKREDVASLERIGKKKEKMLKKIESIDDPKKLRTLEGDKHFLHTELQKQNEIVRRNDKAIIADDLEIRRLETQLLATNHVLADVLSQAPDQEGRAEHRPEGLEENATEVPIAEFDQLVADLDQQRLTMKERERQLEETDGAVEALEKKIDILMMSQKSRDALSFHEYEDMSREKGRIQQHVHRIEEEFGHEQQRLQAERDRLQHRLREVEARSGAN